jgi:hypothetical protein
MSNLRKENHYLAVLNYGRSLSLSVIYGSGLLCASEFDWLIKHICPQLRLDLLDGLY